MTRAACCGLILITGCSLTFSPQGGAIERPPPRVEDSEKDLPDPDTGEGVGDTVVDSVPAVDQPEPLCELELNCAEAIPDEPKVTCAFRVLDGHGRLQYQGPAGVELHGRSSSGFPKPQYSLELRDDSGASVSADLLGMGAESDWILNGAYIDRALFRNKLAYDLFQAFGGPERYAPESSHCTLVQNGVWLGIYFLTERTKRDADRVDIEADEAGTGESFVVKLDDGGGVLANTNGYGYWKLVYPSDEAASSQQIEGIAGWLGSWQTAQVSAEPGDPERGIFAFLDEDSAVDLIIIEEALKNNDAYFLSVHAWKDRGGLLHLSPWDMDLTLGQPLYNDNELAEGWILYRPVWIANMLQVPGFRERLAARWRALRAEILSTEAILGRIDDYRATMGETVYRNFEVWPIEEIQFGGKYLYEVSSYDQEYALVRDWIPRRLAWVDENIDSY